MQVKHPNTTYCLHGYSTQQKNHETLLELHTGASLYLSSLWIALIWSKSTRLVARFQFYTAWNGRNGTLYTLGNSVYTVFICSQNETTSKWVFSPPGMHSSRNKVDSPGLPTGPFSLEPLPNTCATALERLFYFGAAAQTSIILFCLRWCISVHNDIIYSETREEEKKAVASDQGIDLKSSAKFTNVQI